jgi:hypothetical protein
LIREECWAEPEPLENIERGYLERLSFGVFRTAIRIDAGWRRG